MKRPTIVIDEPERKWQHAKIKIDLPPGWELNYTWQRYGPAQQEIHKNYDEKGNLIGIEVGLRRSKFDAVPATKGELV